MVKRASPRERQANESTSAEFRIQMVRPGIPFDIEIRLDTLLTDAVLNQRFRGQCQ
jgi:hypothetical protein